MIEISNGIKLFKHRDYVEWHAPFKSQEHAGPCPNGNCPWDTHWPENSGHDPISIDSLLVLQPGTQMLVLSNYCNHWYVSYNTLSSVFEPSESTQFRFIEESRRCWFFQPRKIPRNVPTTKYGGCGHMMWLDAMRWIATVESNIPSFGRYGKLPCFIRELARIGNVPVVEITNGISMIEKSIPKQPMLLKPWQPLATKLWEQFRDGDAEVFGESMRYLLGFPQGHYTAAILFVVAAQRGKLLELNQMLFSLNIRLPDDFGRAIEYATSVLARHLDNIKEQVRPWWADIERLFGEKLEVQSV